jgi:hypothetical protein
MFSYLDETDVGGLLTEALTAEVEAVLADETGLVGADTAVQYHQSKFRGSQIFDPLSAAVPLLTKHGSPCRNYGGGCTRRIRET